MRLLLAYENSLSRDYAARHLAEADPDVRITTAAGGAGFLPYHMSPDALLGALRILAAGERYLPADMVMRRGVPVGDIILTMREHDVLSGLRSGLSNKEIAGNLSLSEVTVKHHIKSLRGKLGARNRVNAVCRANELDIR